MLRAADSRRRQGHRLRQRFGFDTTDFPHNTQLAIGGGTIGITLIEMARAHDLQTADISSSNIREVRTMSGETIYKPAYPVVRPDCPPTGHGSRQPSNRKHHQRNDRA
jgi:membrane carboxypeptidase/penicillin-binding protein